MKLTVVTDHRFYKCDNAIYDDYVFNYNFFKTYLKVFDEIQIVARVKPVTTVNSNWSVSDGNKVTFIEIPDIHGFKWLFGSSKYFKAQRSAIFNCDAFCFRIPSQSSWIVYTMNQKKLPYMFESIGSPEDAMVASDENLIKRILFSNLGNLLNRRKKEIVKHAATGSYVSLNHLQQKFPVSPGVYTQSISSIRLSSDHILKSPKQFDKDTIKVIHVGSFIPLKNQKDLIFAIKKLAENGVTVKMDFVGDGPLKEKCIALTEKLELSGQVTFHGQVTGFDNIVALLDSASVFVLPSSNEGMPRSLIEAMARGLVCFGSNVGGISELLPDTFTFTPGNVDQIAEKLENCLQHTTVDAYSLISARNISKAGEFEAEELERRRITVLKELKSKIK